MRRATGEAFTRPSPLPSEVFSRVAVPGRGLSLTAATLGAGHSGLAILVAACGGLVAVRFALGVLAVVVRFAFGLAFGGGFVVALGLRGLGLLGAFLVSASSSSPPASSSASSAASSSPLASSSSPEDSSSPPLDLASPSSPMRAITSPIGRVSPSWATISTSTPSESAS